MPGSGPVTNHPAASTRCHAHPASPAAGVVVHQRTPDPRPPSGLTRTAVPVRLDRPTPEHYSRCLSAAMCAAVCQGAEHALLSGCTRLVPHARRRASALHQGDALAAVPCGHHAGAGRQPTDTRCLARGLGAPRVRPAGDGRPPYRPALLHSSPEYRGSSTGQPVIGVAGRRTQGREGCSVVRALQPSVVVVEDVDLIGKERSLRDRVPQSLPGPRSRLGRAAG